MNEHVSVLLKESIEGLCIQPSGIYVDATLGLGGHSQAILQLLSTGHLYAFDQDEYAVRTAGQRLQPYADKLTIIPDNFRHLADDLDQQGIHGIDGMIMDLGVSSPMFDQADRGFSYRLDGPLDMRMNRRQAFSARDVVNGYDRSDLIRILREYGEEPMAGRIADAIIRERQKKAIETTGELENIVVSALPEKIRKQKGHPAKRTFQAIRIEVNDELNALREALDQGLMLLKPGGRIAVISFQSLEDRIVKDRFKQACSIDPEWKKLPLREDEMPQSEYQLVTRKPIMADQKEQQENHRSHSAKLHIIERKCQQ